MIRLYTDTHMLFLPSANWGDLERVESTVQLKRSMNNATKITHVHKVPNSKTFEMSFELTRLKSLELLEFYKIHGSELMNLKSGDDDVRIGYLKINPLDLEKVSRSIVSDSKESVTCQMSFETAAA